MASEVLEGQIVFHRHGTGYIEIKQAPPIARISLELLHQADPVVVKVRGREISFAEQVTYRVTGWDNHGQCLLLERVGEGT